MSTGGAELRRQWFEESQRQAAHKAQIRAQEQSEAKQRRAVKEAARKQERQRRAEELEQTQQIERLIRVRGGLRKAFQAPLQTARCWSQDPTFSVWWPVHMMLVVSGGRLQSLSKAGSGATPQRPSTET